MSKIARKKIGKYLFFLAACISGGLFFALTPAQAASLNGRILLQVEDKGQAWYVNPSDSRRYYLGRPDDAFLVMRYFGLGISNADFREFSVNRAPARLAGRILLKVQEKGQAYYVDPLDRRLYYLGRPADAFSLMRTKGLGISNKDLATIKVGQLPTATAPVATPTTTATEVKAPIAASDKTVVFSFRYRQEDYQVTQSLSTPLYYSYSQAPKTYTYYSNQDESSVRNEFYGLFLKAKTGDDSLSRLALSLKATAALKSWTSDELFEFTLAFIQYIPYDDNKVSASLSNSNPYYPYETLYLNRGVCSDKTFLAVALLRQLGYGAAILDFPEANHTALGVACPKEYSLAASGYCYLETTNYFPISVVPQSITAGQAEKNDSVSDLFNASRLGRVEIYQKTSGLSYQGADEVRQAAASLASLKADIATQLAGISSAKSTIESRKAELADLKEDLTAAYEAGDFSRYNSLVENYNDGVVGYNALVAAYEKQLEDYNVLVNDYNDALGRFYQK